LSGQQNLYEFSEETNGCLSCGQTSNMLPLPATLLTGLLQGLLLTETFYDAV